MRDHPVHQAPAQGPQAEDDQRGCRTAEEHAGPQGLAAAHNLLDQHRRQAAGEEGLGNHLSGVAAAGEGIGRLAPRNTCAAVGRFAGHPHQTQGFGRATDHLGFTGLHLAGKVGQLGRCRRVGLHHLQVARRGQAGQQPLAIRLGQSCPCAGGILALETAAQQQGRLAGAGCHFATVVELDCHLADGFGIFPRLADTHRFAVFVDNTGGVGA